MSQTLSKNSSLLDLFAIIIPTLLYQPKNHYMNLASKTLCTTDNILNLLL